MGMEMSEAELVSPSVQLDKKQDGSRPKLLLSLHFTFSALLSLLCPHYLLSLPYVSNSFIILKSVGEIMFLVMSVTDDGECNSRKIGLGC